MLTDNVAKAISSDGGLFDLGWYLGWNVGSEMATLDGQFTAADLRAIAEYMETTEKKG